MNAQLAEIAEMVARRTGIKGLYLCGPFDEEGKPSSRDIHLLGIVPGRIIEDLHYLPNIANTSRRIEVSLIGEEMLEDALASGVRTWLGFYTIEKLRTARPIVEDGRLKELRKRIADHWKLALSFQALALRNFRDALRSTSMAQSSLCDRMLSSNRLVLQTLTLLAIVRRRTFTKLSELLVASAQDRKLLGERAQERAVAEMLDRCDDLMQSIIKRLGYDAERLRSGSWCNRP